VMPRFVDRILRGARAEHLPIEQRFTKVPTWNPFARVRARESLEPLRARTRARV
jgi:hypothetical protein